MGCGDDVFDSKVSAAIDGGGVLDAGQVHRAESAMANAATQVEERVKLRHCIQETRDAVLVGRLCICIEIIIIIFQWLSS